MRKIFIYISLSVSMMASVSCNLIERHDEIYARGEKTPSVPEINIAEPSPEICEANVFQVDFLTALDDYPYMVGRKLENIRRHIINQEGEPSVLYLIDRMDFQVGKTQPLVKLAKEVGCHPFFAQTAATCLDIIPGTGIMSTLPVRDYDGVTLDGEIFLSGCKMMLPLATTDEVVFYTAHLRDLEQAAAVIGLKNQVFRRNGILVGTLPVRLVNGFEAFVREQEGYRLEVVKVRAADRAFFVMTPMNVVCRKIHKGTSRGRIDYFRISLERIS